MLRTVSPSLLAQSLELYTAPLLNACSTLSGLQKREFSPSCALQAEVASTSASIVNDDTTSIHVHERMTKSKFVQQRQPRPVSSFLRDTFQIVGARDHHAQTHSDRPDLQYLLERHNHSLPSLKGQVIQAKILHMNRRSVYVDAGFHSLSELHRPDLSVSHIHEPAHDAPLSTRVGTSDLRIGDIIKVRVEEIYTPYGDMQLQPLQPNVDLQVAGLWAALVQRAKAGDVVQGRVLNQCKGGYAVGIAGFVGLLPYSKAASSTCQKIGVLQDFYVDRVDDARRTFVLVDAKLAQAGKAKDS